MNTRKISTFHTQRILNDRGPDQLVGTEVVPYGRPEASGQSQTLLVNPPHQLTGDDLIMLCLIDRSGSMFAPCGPQSRLDSAKQAFCSAVALSARREPKALHGVIAFNSAADVISNPVPVAQYSESLCQGIQSIQADGGTRLDAALRKADEMLKCHPDRSIRSVLILTDGHSWGRVRNAANQLKHQGVQIFVTGVGATPSDVNESLLRSISSVIDGQEAYTFVTNNAALKSSVLMHTQMATRRP